MTNPPWGTGDAVPDYPYRDGDTIVLGPEIFAASDGSVICWKGVNYVPQPEPPTEEADPLRHMDDLANLVSHDARITPIIRSPFYWLAVAISITGIITAYHHFDILPGVLVGLNTIIAYYAGQRSILSALKKRLAS